VCYKENGDYAAFLNAPCPDLTNDCRGQPVSAPCLNADGTPASTAELAQRPDAYLAECLKQDRRAADAS